MLFQATWYFPCLITAVAIYWLVGNRSNLRIVCLTAASLLTFAYLLHGNLQNQVALFFLVVMLALICASYAIGARLMRRQAQPLLLLGVSLPFSIFLLTGFGPAASAIMNSSTWLVPVSLGFFALRQSHFVFECYRGGIKQVSPAALLAYILFFPSLVAGPLERFPNFIKQATNARLSWDHFTVAGERLITGALKKFIIADGILAAALPPNDLTQSGFSDVTWWTILFACTIKLLYVYFDFSGYTDMARGTARLFGIELIPNFNFPLFRSNLAQFWRGWHMSLSSFLRDYVYFPLIAKYRNTVVPLLATMIASGAWHGINPGWLLWGVHHGFGLIVLARFQRLAPTIPWLSELRTGHGWRIIATLITWFYIVIGFALTWHPDDLGLSLAIYARLWTLGLF